MIGFWVVFAAFFFGLTYGLLQICTERTILRRERLVGLRLGAYVASKVTILVPFLLLVVVAMLGVLRLLDRLPSRPLSTYASMGVGLLLCAVAALGLGPAHLGHGRQRGSGDARPADAVLPRRVVLGCHPPGEPHGRGRRRPQRGDPVALGLRGDRSRPRGAADPRRGRLATRASAARRRTAMRARSPPAPTG